MLLYLSICIFPSSQLDTYGLYFIIDGGEHESPRYFLERARRTPLDETGDGRAQLQMEDGDAAVQKSLMICYIPQNAVIDVQCVYVERNT